jgi:thiol-disulfide isomerase/thioredoxin
MRPSFFTRTLLSLGLGLALTLAPHSALALQTGETPVIQGKTLTSAPFDLAALRGKVVLVLFWSTDCAVCRDKMPELRANAQGWHGKPFELVSISFDRREQDALDYEKLVTAMVPAGQRFAALWSGNPAYKGNAVRPAQLPTAWLLDKSGKLVETYSGRIPAEAWDKIVDLL